MSKSTKRKYVAKEVEDIFLPTESQSIVKVVGSRGNNLHEVVNSAGEQYLVSMPVKFRRYIWIKAGNFVLVEPIVEGAKVKAEIVKVLTRDHIKWYRAQKCWPLEFDETENKNQSTLNHNNLFVNTNRISTKNYNTPSDSETSNSENSDSETSSDECNK
ncbi:hypothetical protein M0802_012509 [Mischocyttarus mexicanus]|nr:hypothetical protein M0802_012509 [Mischocyttarus mexicanus]